MRVGIFTVLVVGCAMTSCFSGKEGTISGKIKGAEGKTIYLESFANNRSIFTDSTVVGADGTFSITPAQALDKDFYRVFLSEKEFATVITDSTESPVITADLTDFEKTLKVNGSPDSEMLRDLETQLRPFIDKEMAARKKKMAAGISVEEKDQASQMAVEARKQRTDFVKKWLDTHSSTPSALIAVQYLDARTDLAVVNKVFADLQSYFGHTTIYRGLKQQIQMLQKPQPGNEPAPLSKVSVGQPAPEIAQADPKGKTRKLSDLKGKTVLVDFWASWCGPCRRENPNVVEAYKKYNKDGFEVFSVSLDKTKQSWTDAIEKDGLLWPNHVSDLQWWQSAAAKEYGVQSIPFTVLVDKEGKILAHNLRGPQLEERLASIYGH